MSKNQQSLTSVGINCEEWANAKLPKNVEKQVFYQEIIFRILIKRGELKYYEKYYKI